MFLLVDSIAKNKKYRWQSGHMNGIGKNFAVIRGKRDDLRATAITGVSGHKPTFDDFYQGLRKSLQMRLRSLSEELFSAYDYVKRPIR
ncbi:hypothetical protein [Pseudovibrio sp. WM33]|uniref:hypothetical protein n=1 Tax=Pseudovibrio sp. WM33 TaxID=1735585 RepID=UPI0007AE5BB9|nr:hypothetical protein [Pseudovibrio sp. WM33]KZL19092.1 hypothetical protein PsWM33_04812 [Pseudovibrio sp. WM33]